jgi:hypothetical protein
MVGTVESLNRPHGHVPVGGVGFAVVNDHVCPDERVRPVVSSAVSETE